MTGDKGRLLAFALMLLICCVVALFLGGLAKFYLWFLLGFVIGVACHEAGHLLFAVLGSIPIRQFTIGFGPVVLQRRFGDTLLELRLMPLSGFVFHYPLLHYRRWRQVLFLLGGILANAMLIGLVTVVDGLGVVPEQAEAPLGAMVFAQICLIIASIVPYRAKVGGVPIGTDGLQLFQVLWGTHPAAQAGPAYSAVINSYSGSVTVQPAWSEASSRILYNSSRPDRWTDPAARRDSQEALVRELGRGGLPREEEMLVLDALVTDGLVFGDAGLRPRLDEWSARALELGPNVRTLQGSRGAVLVELGRYEEGKALLEPLLAADDKARGLDASIDKLMSQVFLARAEFGLANPTAAQHLSAAARATAEGLPDSPMKAPLRSLAEAALGRPS